MIYNVLITNIVIKQGADINVLKKKKTSKIKDFSALDFLSRLLISLKLR
ncbi:hypothetical protein KAOT1_00730 [Kordia algicida OT-1]|uniref:Uncharacterized protein n=1 Tax=Kordia algicida OT-1 TaxID=391587 RepID=A9EDD9_9FLAO|nr:hypothetical protein KAOT1_00730 [Kordia algicida OT-1]